MLVAVRRAASGNECTVRLPLDPACLLGFIKYDLELPLTPIEIGTPRKEVIVTMRTLFLASTFFLLPLTTSWADPSVLCLSDPILFGNASRFELQGGYMGWSAGAPSWEVTWTVGNCTRTSALLNETENILSIHNMYTGKLKAKCTVVYNNGTGGQTKTFSPEITITVPPPDGVRRVGLPASMRFGTRNPATFQIQCKGQDCFCMNVYMVQELITTAKNPTTNRPLPIPDGSWVPKNPFSPGANLFAYVGFGKFEAKVGYPDVPAVRSMPAGTGLLTATQHYRVILLDPCGNKMTPIPLGKKQMTITKDGQDGLGGTYTTTYQ